MNRIGTICTVLGSFLACSCAGSYPEPTVEFDPASDDSIEDDRILVAQHSQSIDDLEEQLRRPAYAQQTVDPPPDAIVDDPSGPSTPTDPVSPETSSDDQDPEPGGTRVIEDSAEPSAGLEEAYTPEVYGYEIMCGDSACGLRDQICDLSMRICTIAERHPDTDDMEWQCEDATDRCDRADEEVMSTCGCEQWEPTLMGSILPPQWNDMPS